MKINKKKDSKYNCDYYLESKKSLLDIKQSLEFNGKINSIHSKGNQLCILSQNGENHFRQEGSIINKNGKIIAKSEESLNCIGYNNNIGFIYEKNDYQKNVVDIFYKDKNKRDSILYSVKDKNNEVSQEEIMYNNYFGKNCVVGEKSIYIRSDTTIEEVNFVSHKKSTLISLGSLEDISNMKQVESVHILSEKSQRSGYTYLIQCKNIHNRQISRDWYLVKYHQNGECSQYKVPEESLTQVRALFWKQYKYSVHNQELYVWGNGEIEVYKICKKNENIRLERKVKAVNIDRGEKFVVNGSCETYLLENGNMIIGSKDIYQEKEEGHLNRYLYLDAKKREYQVIKVDNKYRIEKAGINQNTLVIALRDNSSSYQYKIEMYEIKTK